MAISKTVLAPSTPLVGIKAEPNSSGYGVSIDASGADGTAYRQLPVIQATRPSIEIVRESRLLSGRGLVKHKSDTYTSSKGGTVTTPFEFWATPKLLAQFLTLVAQEHSESGSYIHTTEIGGQGAMISSVGGAISSNIPHSVNLAYDTGTAGEGIRINGNIVNELTMAFSAGSNNNLMTLSGNFYSGHSYQGSGNSLSTSGMEQDFSGGTWVAPETSYYSMSDMDTKQLDVDGGTLQDLILKDFSLTITNNAVRSPSHNSVGDAEYIALTEIAVTGSMSVKYDAEIDYSGATNVLQDFVDGDTVSLKFAWGDGTVSSAGEMNIFAEIQHVSMPDQDLSDAGIFHTLNFECVQVGTSDGDEALQIQLFNGESQSDW